MQFDSLMLHATVKEIQRSIGDGRRVARVFQTSRFDTILDLAGEAMPAQIVLSCCPQYGRIHFDDGWMPEPSVSYPLGGVLRRWLASAVLVDVTQRDFDRVVRLEFANARALGPQSRFFLILEIMGRHSNLIAVDSEGGILEAAKHVTAQVNRYRQIVPGLEYIPPPDFDRQHPERVTAHYLSQSAAQSQDTAAVWFRNTVQGASDLFRDESLARSDIAPNTPASELTSEDLQRLQLALGQLLETACSNTTAWVYEGPGNTFAYPVELESKPDYTGTGYPDLSSAVAHVARVEVSRGLLEQNRRRLLEAIRRADETLSKRVAERAEGQRQARDAESIRLYGETLLTYLHQVPTGASAVVLPNPYNHEETLQIALNPERSAQQNAQKYFARYKKLAAMERRIGLLLQAARREQHYLAGLLDQIEQAADDEQMADLEAEILQQGYIKRPRKAGRSRTPKFRLQSEELMGYTIIWGTSGLQNDKLLRLAASDDIWLHTRKTPGGHVLIRTNGRPDRVPSEVVAAAASRAARLSKRRTDASVPVDYALAKHVRRLKGTPPGYVHYTNHKTVHANPAGDSQSRNG
jgi:predicted ribosome quality control (RQC) complex YloA/Tae2 family protein